MADKEKKGEDKAPAAAAPAAEKKAGGGMMKSTPVLLGIVMIVEAVILFGGFKFLGGGPKDSHGATPKDGKADAAHGGGDKPAKPDSKTLVEVPVVEFKAPNKVNGNSYLYDVKIFVSAKPENQENLAKIITARNVTIQDRVRTIISQSDPAKLGGGTEPGLETLRRQVKYQLDEIVGEGLVEEVLIAKCIPYSTPF